MNPICWVLGHDTHTFKGIGTKDVRKVGWEIVVKRAPFEEEQCQRRLCHYKNRTYL